MTAHHGALAPATPPGARDRASKELPASDSKYGRQTAAKRADGRPRMQRRQTAGSADLQGIAAVRAPPQRKVTYSQYPDFETIKDPFAKRDRIPRRSERPFELAAEDTARSSQLPSPGDQDNARGGASRSSAGYQAAAGGRGPVSSMAADANPGPDRAPPPNSRTPSKPGYMRQRPGQLLPMAVTRSAAAAPVQMETLDMQLPESPVTPTRPSPAAHAADKPLVPAALMTPVTPRAQTPSTCTGSSEALGLKRSQHGDGMSIEMASLTHSERPFSNRSTNTRLEINMDQVDSLYERRSMLFETQKREVSQTPVRNASLWKTPAASRHADLSRPSAAVEDDDEYDDGEDDDDGDEAIPFDQVLIPTAFKRLRAALEDPLFEVDDETYRRFRLSERWYAREEKLQLERTIGTATLGATRARGRVADLAHEVPVPKVPSPQPPVLEAPVPEAPPSELPQRKRTATRDQSLPRHPAHDSVLDIHVVAAPKPARCAPTPSPAIRGAYIPPQPADRPLEAPYPARRDHSAERRHGAQHASTTSPDERAACCACILM